MFRILHNSSPPQSNRYHLLTPNKDIASGLGDSESVPKLSKSDSNIPTCIESSICKIETQNGVDVYHYTRHYEFYFNLTRRVRYGVDVSHDDEVVPRIVHFTWIKDANKTFRFHHLISLMAAQRFTTPNRIYFWHDELPDGKYWNEALRVIKCMYLVHRERITQIWGQPLFLPVHVSDVMRLEALMEYGGMFFDLDAIVVNNVDPLLKYDVTMGHAAWYILANGILFSKPWADFLMVWYETYSNFKQDYQTNSNIIPNVISMRIPNLIHVENNTLCRPNYGERSYLFQEGVLWDWRRKNYVVHLYMRAYEAEGYPALSPENIKFINNTVSEIARYIYYEM